MLANLKLDASHDGLIYLADATRGLPYLRSHHHSELEVNFVCRGSITYLVDGHRYSFGVGALIWIPSRQEHQLIARSADAQFYVAAFKPSMVNSACRSSEYSDLRNLRGDHCGLLHSKVAFETGRSMRDLMKTLIADAPDEAVLNREAGFGFDSEFQYRHRDCDALNAGLRYLLVHGWRAHKTRSDRSRKIELHPAVTLAVELLSKREASATSLPQIASRCGLSPTYLSRLFHQQLGISLSQYRNSNRLSAFIEHYADGGRRTILDCALAAGFGSYAQFYKVFLSAYGEGPARLIRRSGPHP
jgi:methylphosphotriester-DNA--protein-cysteine methyltransferase